MSLLPEEELLETPCESCGPQFWGNRGDCRYCHGSGYVPTAKGQAILDLIEHNLRRLMKEVGDD